MGRSDLDAVAARRAAITCEFTQIEAKRTDLLAEDRELEVTERVLRRLGEILWDNLASSPRFDTVVVEEGRNRTAKVLLAGTALAGRGWSMIRLAVERRVGQIVRHSR